MVIRSLDDPTQCALFVTPTYYPSVWGTWGQGWAHSVARPWVHISSPLTHMVYLLTFFSYLTGSKSVSGHPSVRPRHDDKYRSESYRFVEQQKSLADQRKKIRRRRDRRPQKRSQPPHYHLRSFLFVFTKLGPGPSWKPYEISVSQIA